MKNINEDHFCSDGCTGSGEARVQQRKRRIQRRVQQKQKDQEDEVFGRILSAKKMKNVDKRVPTIYDHERMKATTRDMLSNQSRDVKEYAYHLEQAKKFMENKRNPNEPPRYLYNKDLFFLKNGNTEEKKYVLSLYKIHATSFPEEDLEEKMIRWVLRVFMTFNEEARLSIQHWKNSWIVKVVKVTNDFMERIIVLRENDKPYSFFEADFGYLNKNDIQDIYQIKINLIASTLTFPSIEACNPYSIVDKPSVGLVYLNNKEEKRVMDLVDIPMFCDTTLEKVLKEVKLKIFKTDFKMKTLLLGKLNVKIMKAYEREIVKRLNLRKQMRRWESFVNERPIL
ncbi:hypothetical protein Tco_1276258 [Tanacetum coccineum]